MFISKITAAAFIALIMAGQAAGAEGFTDKIKNASVENCGEKTGPAFESAFKSPSLKEQNNKVVFTGKTKAGLVFPA